MLIFGFILSFNANAFYSDTKFTPASIQGYTTYGYASKIGENEDMPSYARYSQDEKAEVIETVRDEKVKQIQERYKAEGVQNLADSVEIPVETDNLNETKTIAENSIGANPTSITSEAFEKICLDMGYNKETERNALAFHECVGFAMKTKLTEEEVSKTQYTEIDTNVVKSLEKDVLKDKTIENLVPYNEMITQRNKMDCLSQKDYQKCTKAIIEYKQCYNKAVDYVSIEHEKNKITCYTKTGIRFPNPDAKESYVRDAYFGICIHLIEKDLKATFIKDNAECNKILVKNNILKLAV